MDQVNFALTKQAAFLNKTKVNLSIKSLKKTTIKFSQKMLNLHFSLHKKRSLPKIENLICTLKTENQTCI